jgi:hypothetical protein
VSDFDHGYRDPLWHKLDEKDAEIARLKEVVETLDIEIGGLKEDFQSVAQDQDKLITELANALDKSRCEFGLTWKEATELIQRAREAVK